MDADAFYEQVSPEASITALWLLMNEIAAETGHKQIAVRKTRPMSTLLGGQPVDMKSYFPMLASTWVR